MEKQRKERNRKFFIRLLKTVLLISVMTFSASPVFSQRLTYNIIKELTVKPVNQNNFSGTDCAFELKIPYIKSENVQAQIPDLPNGVNFVSLRRTEYSDTETGTKIELWLNFADSGTYRLRSLRVYLNNRLYYLPFIPIVISENPRNILPQLVVVFDSGTKIVQTRKGSNKNYGNFSAVAGKSEFFTVYLQYGVQIVSLNWSVPKNAIFREIERYDITHGVVKSAEYSEEMIPVVRFEWQPLKSGPQKLPDLQIVATSYNGVRVDLKLPENPLNVKDGVVSLDNKNDAENYFGYAFSSKASSIKKIEKVAVSIEDCEKIAELRKIERMSIPFTQKYNQRKEFEESVGIENAAAEPTYFVFYVFLYLSGFFLLLLIFIIWLKKMKGIIAVSALLLSSVVCVIISFVQVYATYAIFKGGDISPVPELTAGAVASIESGKLVHIGQRAGHWVFVQFGDSGGWVTDNNVIIIDEKEK